MGWISREIEKCWREMGKKEEGRMEEEDGTNMWVICLGVF